MHVGQGLVWVQTFCSTCLNDNKLVCSRVLVANILITELPRADIAATRSSAMEEGEAPRARYEQE